MTPLEARFSTDLSEEGRSAVPLQPEAMLLGGLTAPDATALLADIHRIEAEAPFRNMVTPGGWRMAAAMTSCGRVGW